MNNLKLKIDTTKMLGFRLAQEAKGTTANKLIGSKVGDKPAKPMHSMIGAKVGVKA